MPFLRRFRMNLLTDDLINRNLWFADLLRKWYPAGSQSDQSLSLGQDHLRLAIRDNELHFYRAGWRVGSVHLPPRGELWSEISAKYVYGESNEEYPNVKVTSHGYPVTPGTANLVPYEREVCMSRWIANANNQVGPEKRFVDEIVTNNPNVIDLEVRYPGGPPEPGTLQGWIWLLWSRLITNGVSYFGKQSGLPMVG